MWTVLLCVFYIVIKRDHVDLTIINIYIQYILLIKIFGIIVKKNLQKTYSSKYYMLKTILT